MILIAVLLVFPLALVLKALYGRYVTAPAQLNEDARIMLAANPSHRAPLRGAAEIRRLAESVNAFADANESLQRDFDQRVREANARIEQERNRLAALMSELAQSVIMCNVEGRILLYNARAMQLLRKPLASAAAAGKAHSLVGLGRSIFAIFDRNLIIHALESIHDRLRQGARGPVANFVTTAPGGQLVRVQMAPVLGAPPDATAAAAADGISGFVLVLDNITRRIEAGNRRDLLLQTLTQGTRASLASMRAAIETIASFPDMDQAARDRFIGIIGEEAQHLSGRLDADGRRVRRFAADRVAAGRHARRGPDRGGATADRKQARAAHEAGDRRRVDLAQRRQLFADAGRLPTSSPGCARSSASGKCASALEAAGPLAHLDVIWTGAPLGTETTMAWQTDAMEMGGEACPLTLKQIIERHNGEIWYQIHKAVAPRVLPDRDPGDQARGVAVERAAARRKPARILRFRPFPSAGPVAGAGQPAAHRVELHRVRHRNHRAAAVPGR